MIGSWQTDRQTDHATVYVTIGRFYAAANNNWTTSTKERAVSRRWLTVTFIALLNLMFALRIENGGIQQAYHDIVGAGWPLTIHRSCMRPPTMTTSLSSSLSNLGATPVNINNIAIFTCNQDSSVSTTFRTYIRFNGKITAEKGQ